MKAVFRMYINAFHVMVCTPYTYQLTKLITLTRSKSDTSFKKPSTWLEVKVVEKSKPSSRILIDAAADEDWNTTAILMALPTGRSK